MDDLLQKIEQHLAMTGTAPATFGRAVLNNPNFVFDLRSGKANPTARTVARIEDAIAAYSGGVSND